MLKVIALLSFIKAPALPTLRQATPTGGARPELPGGVKDFIVEKKISFLYIIPVRHEIFRSPLFPGTENVRLVPKKTGVTHPCARFRGVLWTTVSTELVMLPWALELT